MSNIISLRVIVLIGIVFLPCCLIDNPHWTEEYDSISAGHHDSRSLDTTQKLDHKQNPKLDQKVDKTDASVAKDQSTIDINGDVTIDGAQMLDGGQLADSALVDGICNHECPVVEEKKCVSPTMWQICTENSQGCRVWSAPKNCLNSEVCYNNACCAPNCGDRECNSNSCGGYCGSCNFGCLDPGYCKRKIKASIVNLPCSLCGDLFGNKPDIYVQLTLDDGIKKNTYTYRNTTSVDTCGENINIEWDAGSFDYTYLKNATIEIYDEDTIGNDDLCVEWTNVNLTTQVSHPLEDQNARVIIESLK